MGHTKGPWHWVPSEFGPALEREGDDDDPGILWAQGCGNKHETTVGIKGCLSEGTNDPMRGCAMHPSKADRDLIAAAPDLLAACERLLAAAPAFRSAKIGAAGSDARLAQQEHIAAEEQARAAIAKAHPTHGDKA